MTVKLTQEDAENWLYDEFEGTKELPVLSFNEVAKLLHDYYTEARRAVYMESERLQYLERFETRLMLHRLIQWNKGVNGARGIVPDFLIRNAELILSKWSTINDVTRK